MGRWGRFIGRSPLLPGAESWFRGALGEIEVGRILTKLDGSWTVLHAVPVGSAETDIDHVLISPAGVFTLNTKNHAGKKVWIAGSTLKVNGQNTPHLHASVSESKRATKLLSAAAGFRVDTTALIVVVRPASLVAREPHRSVVVMSSPSLLKWLRRRPAVLDEDALRRIRAIAVAPSTWHTAPAPFDSDDANMAKFAVLQRRVDVAIRTRRAWLAASALALLVAVFGGAAFVLPLLSAGLFGAG